MSIFGDSKHADSIVYRQAKLGSIHSKDIFDAGLKIANRQESLFEAQVAEEKEKDLSHQLKQLRYRNRIISQMHYLTF